MGRTSDYGKSVHRQLEEIMGRLSAVESDMKKEKREHKEDLDRLHRKIEEKDRKIKVLTEDNERLKPIIHNDSSNSSLPPSIDQKGKPAYIRNQSNATSVLYSSMEKKNLETLKETGILSRFSGTLMHDHETAKYHFGTVPNSLILF